MIKLSRVRVFIGGENLFVIYDKVKIVDPETLGNTQYVNSETLSTYPIQRILYFGVNVSF